MAVSARRAAGYRKFRDRRERAAPAFLPPLAWSASFSLVGCASFHLSPMSHHRTRHAPMCLEPEGRIHGKRCEHGIYDARSLHARRHPPSSVRRAVLWATLSHAVLVHVKARREEASHALPVTKARPAEPCRAAQRPGSSLPHMQSYRSGTRRLYGIPWRTVLRLVGCSSHCAAEKGDRARAYASGMYFLHAHGSQPPRNTARRRVASARPPCNARTHSLVI